MAEPVVAPDSGDMGDSRLEGRSALAKALLLPLCGKVVGGRATMELGRDFYLRKRCAGVRLSYTVATGFSLTAQVSKLDCTSNSHWEFYTVRLSLRKYGETQMKQVWQAIRECGAWKRLVRSRILARLEAKSIAQPDTSPPALPGVTKEFTNDLMVELAIALGPTHP